MDSTTRLASTVADAADAWLRDPLDVNVYQRLVEATTRWRDHRQPQLSPGVEQPELTQATEPADDVVLPGTLADGIRDLAAQLRPPADPATAGGPTADQ